jgi:hypothetical protein
MPESRKLRVFLCHASQDKPTVRELYQKLAAEGWIDPWLDEEKLLPGQDWDLEIEKAVEAADAIIVCLSGTSISKEGYVQKEIKVALNYALYRPEDTIFIVPLRLDDCSVPRHLSTIQYIDYFPLERKEWAIQRLFQALKIRHTQIKKQHAEKLAEEERARSESRENARRTEEQARREAAEKAKLEAEENTRKEEAEIADRLAREKAKKETEEKEKHKVEMQNVTQKNEEDETSHSSIEDDKLLLKRLEKIRSEYSPTMDDYLDGMLWKSLPTARKKHFKRIRVIVDMGASIFGAIIMIILILSHTVTWEIVLTGFFAVGLVGIADGMVKRAAIDPELKRRIEILKNRINNH